jgi:hypothetical protein
MSEQPKTIDEIELLIRSNSEELTEEDLERYLVFSEIQEKLDLENMLAVLCLDGVKS